MVKFFSFLIVCHVQCYLSPFLYSSRSQPSFICPTVLGNALSLFWYLDGIVLLPHHSQHRNYPEIYLDGYVKKWTLILILALMSSRLFNSFSTNSKLFSARLLPKKFFTMSTNDVQARYYKSFIELIYSPSLMSFLMLWWNHFHDVHRVQWNRCIQLGCL